MLNKIGEDQLIVIQKHIDEGSFQLAEDSLLKMRRKNKDSRISYLLGYIHHINLIPNYFSSEKENVFEGSKVDAYRYLSAVVDSKKPIEDSFWRLADLEENKKHSTRILKSGLKLFPQSFTIYEYLIRYLPDGDIETIYNEIESKNIASYRINFLLYSRFLKKKSYDFALLNLFKIDVSEKKENNLLKLAQGYCLFELGETNKSIEIFNELLSVDVTKSLEYGESVGLILCLIKLGRTDEIPELIDELPFKFDEPWVYLHSYLYYDFSGYVNLMIKELIPFLNGDISLKSKYAKIRGMRAFAEYRKKDKVSQTNIRDFEFAKNNSGDAKKYEIELVDIYIYSQNLVKAYNQDLLNSENYSDYISSIDDILESLPGKKYIEIVDHFSGRLAGLSTYGRSRLLDMASSFISSLFKNKRYEYLVRIAENYSLEDLEKKNVIFDLAYSYGEIDNIEKSKEIYERIRNDGENNSSVANNLGVIHEKEGDYYVAEDLFKKALSLDPSNELYAKNLARVEKIVDKERQEVKKRQKNSEEAMKKIKNENIYIIEKLFLFMSSADDKGNIVKSYYDLCTILKASIEKVKELVKKFLDKKYVYKIEDHDYDTYSNVYRVCGKIKQYIASEKERIEENKIYSSISESINLDAIEELGYSAKLLKTIDAKVSNSDLKSILKRDLKENALALLTQSYKTSIVLSGSIIESIVLNKLIESSINKHKPSEHAKNNKKVLNMNFSELLYVANENGILDIQLYHFSQALKHYRNFIHPGVEIRKTLVNNLDSDNAYLAWNIVKKVISGI